MTTSSDTTEHRGATLGGRLRRLSAMIDADVARVYAAHGIVFEQRWFGVINQLSSVGPLSVGELAAKLGITHASVSETRRSLEHLGLIESDADPIDARRRVLKLSAAGIHFERELRPLWTAFDDASRELDQEAGGVALALEQLDRALERAPLSERISAHFEQGQG